MQTNMRAKRECEKKMKVKNKKKEKKILVAVRTEMIENDERVK